MGRLKGLVRVEPGETDIRLFNEQGRLEAALLCAVGSESTASLVVAGACSCAYGLEVESQYIDRPARPPEDTDVQPHPCAPDRRARGRGRCADSSGRSGRFASAIRLDPLGQHGSDAASNGLENSRLRTERRMQSQSRQRRATVPSPAPTAPRSSSCASPPRDSRECTRSGDSVHEGEPRAAANLASIHKAHVRGWIDTGFGRQLLRSRLETTPAAGRRVYGGEGGIRTHDPLAGTPVFKSQGTLTRATHPHANAYFSRIPGQSHSL